MARFSGLPRAKSQILKGWLGLDRLLQRVDAHSVLLAEARHSGALLWCSDRRPGPTRAQMRDSSSHPRGNTIPDSYKILIVDHGKLAKTHKPLVKGVETETHALPC